MILPHTLKSDTNHWIKVCFSNPPHMDPWSHIPLHWLDMWQMVTHTPQGRGREDPQERDGGPPAIGGSADPPWGRSTYIWHPPTWCILHASTLISTIDLRSVWSKGKEEKSHGLMMWHQSSLYFTSSYKYPLVLHSHSWHIGVNHSIVALAKLCHSVMQLGREWGKSLGECPRPIKSLLQGECALLVSGTSEFFIVFAILILV
jgi:hypothetical protein